MISKIKIISKALGVTDTFSDTSRAFIMIVELECVVNNDGVIMCITGKKPVCSSLCVKIVEWDCAKLDFLKCLKYNLDMVTYK